MNGFIDGFDFHEMEAMKYYAPPAAWSAEKNKQNVISKIYSGEWYGAEKKDGYFVKIIKDEDGVCFVLPRSRNVNKEFVNKIEWVPHWMDWFNHLPNGCCFLGEAYLPSKPGSSNITSILGCLKDKAVARQEKEEYLHLYIFDVLAFNGHSMMKDKFLDRIIALNEYAGVLYSSQYVDYAKYVNGDELWNTLQDILARGDEGVVITKHDALYDPGKRSAKVTLKVKKELSETIDAFFTGRIAAPTKNYTGKELGTWKYWYNERTGECMEGEYYIDYFDGKPITPVTKPYFHGWAGSLEIGVMDGNKIKSIGWLSGLTDEIKANPDKYKGRCIAVGAMQWTDAEMTALRHGRMISFRDDLTMDDCTWDKIIGKE